MVPRDGGGEVRLFFSDPGLLLYAHSYPVCCRFRRWLLSLATSDGFFIVPPVDVWLVWHTYMLNPMLVPKFSFWGQNSGRINFVGAKVVYGGL